MAKKCIKLVHQTCTCMKRKEEEIKDVFNYPLLSHHLGPHDQNISKN